MLVPDGWIYCPTGIFPQSRVYREWSKKVYGSSLRENALLMSVVREQTVSSLEEGISHSNNHSLNTIYAAAYFLMHNKSNLEVDEL